MSLPKLTVPKYEIMLPLTGLKLTARPFLVKEEKVLMVAFESGDAKIIVGAIADVIQSCVFEKFDLFELPLVDAEYLIIKLKSFSRGESIDLTMKCRHPIESRAEGEEGQMFPCGYEGEISISLEHLGADMDTSSIAGSSIKLSDNVGVKMRPPRFGCMTSMVGDQRKEADHIMTVLIDSIESVYTEDEVFPTKLESYEDMEAFVGEMDVAQFKLLKEYFASIPVVEIKQDYTCPQCKHHEVVNVRDLNDFFA